MDSASKVCRNCGGNDFYSQNSVAWNDSGAMLPLGMFSIRELHIRVCGDCGLVEWFAAPKTLAKVKAKFHRESPETQPA